MRLMDAAAQSISIQLVVVEAKGILEPECERDVDRLRRARRTRRHRDVHAHANENIRHEINSGVNAVAVGIAVGSGLVKAAEFGTQKIPALKTARKTPGAATRHLGLCESAVSDEIVRRVYAFRVVHKGDFRAVAVALAPE